MRKWLAVVCLLALVSCAGSKELPSSTQGEGSDALRISPCACEFEDFDPELFEWVES